MYMLQLRSISRGNPYPFFVFVFATGHPIQPTNLLFGMKAHCSLDRAKKSILLIIFIFDGFRAIFPDVFRVVAKRVENAH